MFRYFSIVRPSGSDSAEAAASLVRQRLLAANADWHLVFKTLGAEVYCTGVTSTSGEAVQLEDHHGVLLGRAFSTDAASLCRRFTANATRHITESRGASLVKTHWGSYVLFLKDLDKDDLVIFRGPMAVLPCFWVTFRTLTLVFSQVEDCVSLGLSTFSVNWDCIRVQAVGGDYLGQHTSLNELHQLICGEALHIRGEERVSEAYWAPPSISASPSVTDMPSAALVLRQVAETCVRAWVSLHRTCLIRLSGGLDSSIVLACAKQASSDTELICVHFWSGGPGDERIYARGMARASNIELLEYERDSDVDLRRFLTCSLTGNPPVHFTAYDEEPRLIALAKRRSATGIFSGEIGDDLFGHAPFAGCLLQALHSAGAGRRFARAALDYASLRRLSLWETLSQLLEFRRFQRATEYWSPYRFTKFIDMPYADSLASRDCIYEYETSLIRRYIHPWFRNVRKLPAGSLMLIRSMIAATSTRFHSPFGGADGDLFATPLASQPLIEAFWRIPSQLHFDGGESGAVARAAFASALTNDVLYRGTSKATPGRWAQEVIARNRPLLRELLLDGILASQRILDRKKLEEALSGEVTTSQVLVADLLIQLYIECWLRGWKDLPQKAVA